ncbi:bifunctional tRNA (5-methylaminomethyl-2-thiouridine)(34)-methyltransferase MnmD/FAD-dependent 5-carboxymethylaminomethyl-2-thiouridine(34) oxidoreductase MnmC [uncultured Zoogloea sp.]|uniref:bifunctional tRNA (5-methylaminomethyl-2-thiouridine)(34)-methyltransferase MnmD/FAD-dependent 5-carboxymethylaminomethyl-2-thiouridine(34) oxidoreductase MnmC n=1 Tax=uncultured Zoogloea sp. TaxID=160237 RepID=UPI002610D7DA|nr:bifunctional tRNA (5-methylaminomethyl-2-thiouridine)(34)-methyltransferase MnmD/FAD-dependent 5-carboxymethylaminomethyl-2-thiouridine(34) oxidoreductase MnmC [uncultured Zoogloea sp.]
MFHPIVPARIVLTDDNTPYSPTYDDVYHTTSGGLGQARQVFLDGNRLPSRWIGRERFTIIETGFGLGLNFLATWDAWRSDPARCAQLHFVSVEKHPFCADDLARLHAAWPELAPLAGELQRHWPALTPGVHRLHLDGGRVVLTLIFGDAVDALPQLHAAADAFFLDGFSPARNPDLWSPAVFAQLARLAASGATLATWSVNGNVRRGLETAGFTLERRAGFGGKREMLTGHRADAPAANQDQPRRALVIGAGVAGTSVAERLAARGWQVTVIDEADGPGQGASGNRAGVFRPLPSLDDNRLARITRAGFLYGRHHLARLAEAGHPVRWAPTGVLHLARDDKQAAKMQAVVDTHQYPTDYLRFADRDEASRLANWPMAQGGWWFPQGGWIQPPTLCAANLAAGGDRITTVFGRRLARLERRGDDWLAFDESGAEIARAAVMVLANGVGIRAIPEAASLPVRPARGQVSHLPATPDSAPEVVVCRLGYVSPEVDGVRCAGATFIADDDGTELREAEHRENLTKLDFILPGFSAPFDPASLDGRVGFRPASPDRLPMVGAVPAVANAERTTPLADIPRQPGLFAATGFGARGLVWASLVGELLASQINGDPLPLERDLVDALDPARYLLKPPRPGAGSED